VSTPEILYQEACEALKYADAPYSGLKVGVAVLTERGKVYRGCNFENPSLMMSLCAEKVAVLKALSEGEKEIKALMIVSSDGDYCPPCGSCRQFILEYTPNAEVYLGSKKGIKKYTIKELLPHAFKRR
jgi:cytidine deaminase